MNQDEKQCLWCAETIKAQARICRFCNREQSPAGQPQQVQAQTPQQEAMLLNEGGVWVTSQRAHFTGTVYAIANITSIKQGEEDASAIAWALGVVGMAAAVFSWVAIKSGGCTASCALVGGLFIAIGALSKADHWIKLTTSGIETQALVSKDKAFVDRVSAAIQQAMAMRSR